MRGTRKNCRYCKEVGHRVRDCPKMPDVETPDDKLMDDISKIPNVWRVFSTMGKDYKIVYEVYMDTTELRKNSKDEKFKILNSDNIKIMHSSGFITSLDHNRINYGATIYNDDGFQNPSVGTIGLFLGRDGKHYGLTCGHVADGITNSTRIDRSPAISGGNNPKVSVLTIFDVDLALISIEDNHDEVTCYIDDFDIQSIEEINEAIWNINDTLRVNLLKLDANLGYLKVYKKGSTTGLTMGLFRGFAKSNILNSKHILKDIDVIVIEWIESVSHNTNTFYFDDDSSSIEEIEHVTKRTMMPFARPGDSGSLCYIVNEDDRGITPIGIHFSSDYDTNSIKNLSYAIPIDVVLEKTKGYNICNAKCQQSLSNILKNF